MTYRTHAHFGPESTPRSLKILILITIAFSLISAFFPVVRILFSLSPSGVSHLYLWQFLTYVFIAPSGISFSFFVILAFNMYLLWAFGASLIHRSRPFLFFSLYFGSAVFAGLLAILPMALGLQLHSFLAGTSPALYAVLIAWVMLNPESELLLFFSLPLKAKWLVLGLLGANLLLDLSNGDWIGFLSNAGSAVFGYFFTLAAWREPSPFSFLRSFERMIFRTLDRAQERWRKIGKKKPPKEYRHSKIYDIHSGEPLIGDEQFMDAMLARISLYGEDSLTPEEKRRMQAISAKKNTKKK